MKNRKTESYMSLLKSKKIAVFILFSSLLFATFSCNKVKGDFKLNAYEYEAGETLDILNYSKSDVWTITNPAGVITDTIYDRNPTITIGLFDSDGMYELNLHDNDRKLEKGISSSKPFVVKTIRNTLTIHGNGDYEDSFTAYVDNIEIGESNEDENVFVNLPNGLWLIKVIALNGETETKTVSVSTGGFNFVSFY